MTSYAVRADYVAWAGNQAGSDVDDALLARASAVVDDLTAGVPYPLTGDGTPAVQGHIEGLRSATCAQAHFMDETGDASGAIAAAGAVSIGSVQLAKRVQEGQRVQDTRYAPEAVQALRRAGLLNRRVHY